MKFSRNGKLKTCAICGTKKREGINIHSYFICAICEEEIVHTEVNNERYTFFIKKMKENLLKNA
ncbi:MAG: sigma factor G inhibitor Gin [Vulcanibacillus sp.]